jgi:hypothetical protein
MPTIYDTTTAALATPGRFPADALLLDVRYRSQWPSPSCATVAALFPDRYLFVPALGTEACASGASQDPRQWQPYAQLIDWRRGVQAVAQAAPTTDIVVLCTCLECYQRSHRRQVAQSLAQALGWDVGGTLP